MSFVLKISDRFRNRRVLFFNDFSFNLVHDAIASTFSVNFYFDPNNPEHKEFACVTHYHEVTVEYNGEMLLKGMITSQKFRQSSVKELASISGYSLPGILEDCQIPPKLYPLQSDGLTLRQITQKLIQPFEFLELVVDSSVAAKVDKSFKTSTASETESIREYLSGLASQKDIVITHDEQGRILFTEAKTYTEPVLELDLTKPDQLIGTTYEMSFEGQAIHSHITVQKQASMEGGNAGSVTVRNPYVIGSVYRPAVTSQSSGDDIDTDEAATRAMADELRNIKLTITTDRWLLPNGKIIRPNQTIAIYAPELYIYRRVVFFIESVSYTGDEKQTVATLNCVLPEVYNNKRPEKSIYSGINLHA